MELVALVDGLVQADKFAVQSAAETVSGLPAIGPCLDEDQLRRRTPPPRELRPEIQAIRAALLHADALERSGKYTEALAEATAALAEATAARVRADELDWPRPRRCHAPALELAEVEAWLANHR